MAAGTLSAPGTEHGPCEEKCEHADCRETRLMSATVCHYCEEPIGYETRFYRDEGGELVHASCHEDSIEARR